MPSVVFQAESSNVHKLREAAEFALRRIVSESTKKVTKSYVTIHQDFGYEPDPIVVKDSDYMYSAEINAAVAYPTMYSQNFVLSWEYGE